ncbi:hypothetical protein [Maribellus sediminis]|uniref:hypothetical protein n=1 Tax=Maribellus sediminis TaxID=2696285 RepID=UPI001430633E|nr:hypothetical protein [Maribellus sediminis]
MKEKDYIEELIANNLDALNDNEPFEGHFERFEAKLKAKNRTRKISLNLVLKVAAVVVFAFLATNQAFIYFSPDSQGLILNANKSKAVTLASVSPEYQEVEFYYTTSINTGLEQWNALSAEGMISEDEEAMMQDELKEFERLYKNLQSDLAANPNDERVINAMLEFYQTKLSLITMIVNKLEEVKQQKNNHNESI